MSPWRAGVPAHSPARPGTWCPRRQPAAERWLRLIIPNDFGFLTHPNVCHAAEPAVARARGPDRVCPEFGDGEVEDRFHRSFGSCLSVLVRPWTLTLLRRLGQFESYVPDVEFHAPGNEAGEADLQRRAVGQDVEGARDEHDRAGRQPEVGRLGRRGVPRAYRGR